MLNSPSGLTNPLFMLREDAFGITWFKLFMLSVGFLYVHAFGAPNELYV